MEPNESDLDPSLAKPSSSVPKFHDAAVARARAGAGNVWSWSQRWARRSWLLALRLAKGAYLVQERQKLLARLGDEAHRAIIAGQWQPPTDAKTLILQLERIERKIRLEEFMIARIRFRGEDASETGPSEPTGTPYPDEPETE